MKTVKVIAALALTAMTAAVMAGCLYVNIGGGKAVTGSGRMGTREVELATAPTALENVSSIDVIIDPELTGKAVIEGDDNLIEYVRVEQDANGELTVDYQDRLNIIVLKRMTVRIPAIMGGRIAVHGSGDISQAGGILKGEGFNVKAFGSGDISLVLEAPIVMFDVDGSGDVKAAVQADELTVSIDGSGDVAVSGAAKTLTLYSGGSGGFSGFGLSAADAEVTLNGSGDAQVTVSGRITGSVGGSGDLTIGGSPASVDVDDNGSGDVRKR